MPAVAGIALAASCADEGAGEPDDPHLLVAGFTEEFHIGDDPAERPFADIFAMDFSPSGELAVLDRAEFAVSVFDRDGREIARWGNQGEGPGEFSNDPNDLAVSSNGIVAVSTQTRVDLFTLDGTVVDTRNLGGGWVMNLMFDGTGTLVLRWRPMESLRALDEPGSEQIMRLEDGEVLWTSPQLNAVTALRLWDPWVVQAGIGTGRIVVGMSNSYEMAVLAVSDGSVLGGIGRSVPVRGPSDEFVDNLSEFVGTLPMAETFPMIGSIFVGPPNRTIWVGRLIGVDDSLAPPVGESIDDWTYRLYDLFDGDSYEYIGTVEIPEDLDVELKASDGERVAGVHRDELGVESVRVLRMYIERP